MKLCKSLLGFHALTGCDYTASFNRKGKVKPFKMLQKNPSIQDAFSALAFQDGDIDEIINMIEGFVCTMYGKKKLQLCQRNKTADIL